MKTIAATTTMSVSFRFSPADDYNTEVSSPQEAREKIWDRVKDMKDRSFRDSYKVGIEISITVPKEITGLSEDIVRQEKIYEHYVVGEVKTGEESPLFGRDFSDSEEETLKEKSHNLWVDCFGRPYLSNFPYLCDCDYICNPKTGQWETREEIFKRLGIVK